MISSAIISAVGHGDCGPTSDHIWYTAEAVLRLPMRAIPERPVAMRLSGLEPFELVV